MKKGFGKTARAVILALRVTVSIHIFLDYTGSWLWREGLATLGHVGS